MSFLLSFLVSAPLTYCSKNTESIYKNRLAVDLPEFKGKHRKFRNLVSSYLGKCSVQKNFKRYQSYYSRLVAFSFTSLSIFFVHFLLTLTFSVSGFLAKPKQHVFFYFIWQNPEMGLEACILFSQSSSCRNVIEYKLYTSKGMWFQTPRAFSKSIPYWFAFIWFSGLGSFQKVHPRRDHCCFRFLTVPQFQVERGVAFQFLFSSFWNFLLLQRHDLWRVSHLLDMAPNVFQFLDHFGFISVILLFKFHLISVIFQLHCFSFFLLNYKSSVATTEFRFPDLLFWTTDAIWIFLNFCVSAGKNAALKHSPSKKKLTARTRATSVTDSAAPANYDQLATSQESGNLQRPSQSQLAIKLLSEICLLSPFGSCPLPPPTWFAVGSPFALKCFLAIPEFS